MPYYRGDFGGYGGYMQGDPGFFSGLLRLGKGILGLGGGGATKVIQVGAPAAERGIMRIPAVSGAIERIRKLPLPVKVGGVIGAAAGVQRVMGGAARRAPPEGMEGLPRGYHISRKTGKVVRNRRMRVTNPRALRRAIRRANGFARLARRVLHFTSPRRPRGRAVFKRHRRRAA